MSAVATEMPSAHPPRRSTTPLCCAVAGDAPATGADGVAFIEAIGAKGKMIKARAINDYTIEMPVEDAGQE